MHSTLNPSADLQFSDDAVAAEVSGEIVLISIASGRYYGLDAIGSDIWRRLETAKSFDALCAELSDSYDGEPDTIRRDTQTLVETLLERGLLTQTT